MLDLQGNCLFPASFMAVAASRRNGMRWWHRRLYVVVMCTGHDDDRRWCGQRGWRSGLMWRGRRATRAMSSPMLPLEEKHKVKPHDSIALGCYMQQPMEAATTAARD